MLSLHSSKSFRKKRPADFRIARELKKGIGRALADAVILEPNFAGMGFSFKKIIEYFKNK